MDGGGLDGDGSHQVQDHTDDTAHMQHKWREASVIIYTAMIEAGFSYEVGDVHRVYGYWTTGAGSATQFMQMLHRVRHES